MKLRFRILLFLLLVPGKSFTIGLMVYTVDLRDASKHLAHVTLEPKGYHSKSLEFQMPVWAPGAYSVTHYGRFITNFQAVDANGVRLAIEQMNADRWRIKSATHLKSITYDVLDSHNDTTSLYYALAQFDSNLVFANATAYFGYVNDDKNAKAKVVYKIPNNWLLTTALPQSPKGYSNEVPNTFKAKEFYARNYDELVDAPIMAAPHFQSRSFREGSAIYDLVVVCNKEFPIDTVAEYTRQIVACETAFFHDTPFKRYTFMIHAIPWSHLNGPPGALEHANSSDFLLGNMELPLLKPFLLQAIAHEFFHLWNVKRIHSSLLGPFDYTRRVMTTSLWLSEGITDYYAQVLLSRCGLQTEREYYENMRWKLPASSAGGNPRSLEELSIAESDFKLEDARSFYTKGPFVGLMLDIEIRSRTNNKHSLDDVMLALNEEAKKGIAFEDSSLIHKIEGIVELDLSDFYNRYIHGADNLPIAEYFSKMGLEIVPSDELEGGLNTEILGSFTFQHVPANTLLGATGMKAGDKLLSMNGVPISVEHFSEIQAMRKSGKAVHVKIEREGKEMTFYIDPDRYDPGHRNKGWLRLKEHRTALEDAIRMSILG